MIDKLKPWLDAQRLPIIVTTAEGEILHVTPATADAFPASPEIQNASVNTFDWLRSRYADEKTQQHFERLIPQLKNGPHHGLDPVILSSDDKKSWKLTLVPQFSATNAPPFWLWVFQDTSSSLLLEQHENHAQKMEVISRFAGGMAHEFNNQLTAILGNLDLSRMDVSRPVSAVVDRLDAAEKAAMRMSQLIQQLRRFAGRESITQEVQPLLPVVQRVQASLSELCDERIAITVTTANDDSNRMLAKFNAEQLEDALMKLGENAREAIGDLRGAINFDLKIVNADDIETLQITIEDTGSGMQPDAQSRAFEPFFTTKAPNISSGLGMAVAYGLIEEMNGAVQILNSTGAGTEVRVSLPISPLPAANK